MAPEIQIRTIGDIAVVACHGRLVEGPETSELDRCARALLEMRHRHVVLDLHAVPFVDSAGLGLLVRLQSGVRGSGGDLTLCGLAPTVQNTLRVTRFAYLPHRRRREPRSTKTRTGARTDSFQRR